MTPPWVFVLIAFAEWMNSSTDPASMHGGAQAQARTREKGKTW